MPAATKPVEAFDEVAQGERALERARRVVDEARRVGADEAEAYVTRSQTVAVRFEKGDLKLAQVDDGSTLGLRTFKDRRLGFASSNQSDARALQQVAADAVALAGFAVPDEHNRLPAARAIAARPSLVEPELAATSVETVVELAREFMSRATSVDKRISIDGASCDLSRVTHAVHSSRGVDASESDASLSLSVMGMAIDGDDVGGFHYAADSFRKLADVEPAMDRLVEQFTSVALGNLAAGPAETYTGPVLFSPDALLSVLISPVISAASAIAVQRGRSALGQKLGQSIAVSALDVVDDPTDVTLSGAGAFDREGQPTSRFAIVERGVLASYLYNGYAAAVEGRTSTGHAKGGARSVPGLGVHALVVRPGTGGDLDAMLRSLSRGLFVQRFSGTVDPASGDFSGVAKSARWVENGKVVRSVRETLLAGNAFRLLSSIATLSSVGERCMGASRAPFAIVDGVSVTAG